MMQPPQQSEPIDFLTAAYLIAEAHDRLGKPDWFPGWLRRIAKDFEQPQIGEPQGRA
jgi:hypothetical protein